VRDRWKRSALARAAHGWLGRAANRWLAGALRGAARSSIGGLLRRTNERGQPNINELWMVAKDIDILRSDVKNFGYEMARQLSEQGGLARKVPSEPPRAGLRSQATTQADLESEWAAYWCDRLKIRPIYNRKIWEFCYVLQALRERVPGFLTGGSRGIGFVCGQEPLPSLLAQLGHELVVTDLPLEDSIGRGWVETGQHLSRADLAFHASLVDRPTFDQRVSVRHMDMNHVEGDLDGQFDFCWSICALEHLGSIAQGLDFIENSARVLRPGGTAVHTTEFNYGDEDETIDDWPVVLFQRRHFEQIARRLEGQGLSVAPLDFDVGSAPMDRFVDVPPYPPQGQARHLKLAIDGFRCTCFGLIFSRPR